MNKWQDLSDYVLEHQCQWSFEPEEGEWGIHHLDTPPYNRLLGPVIPRGTSAGLLSIGGDLQCSWGDTERADMTFSVTKTYLAMVASIAVKDGLIRSVDEPVYDTLLRHGVSVESMITPHNRPITWRQFLQFTSEWSGACFGIPDQIDHFRTVDMQPSSNTCNQKGERRSLSKPGTYWEYNDVRINQFALLLTRLFDRSIPEVFCEAIAQPVGLSDSWRWYGYDNSDVELTDGTIVKSVPGGGHWGGGMVISPNDQMLLAQLLMNSSHHHQQILDSNWVEAMKSPCGIAPWYGYFLWLNTNHCISRAASEQSYFAMGIGGQLIWHEPALELIGVFRWIDTAYTEQILNHCVRIATHA